MLQPIDAGFDRSIKYHIAAALHLELENPDLLDKWVGGRFSARERRMMMTRWAGNAYDSVLRSKRNERYFLKTGSLLRVDGKKNAINIQALPQYIFPPKYGGSDVNISIDLSSDDESSNGDDLDSDDGFESADGLCEHIGDGSYAEEVNGSLDDAIYRWAEVNEPEFNVMVSVADKPNWENVNSRLHSFHVDTVSNPSKWPLGNKEASLIMLREFLQVQPGHVIATMHVELLQNPIEALVKEYNDFRSRTSPLDLKTQ